MHQMSNFKAKMHQIIFPLGSLQHSLDSSFGFEGPTSKGMGGKLRERRIPVYFLSWIYAHVYINLLITVWKTVESSIIEAASFHESIVITAAGQQAGPEYTTKQSWHSASGRSGFSSRG